jgi:hypothetical protein
MDPESLRAYARRDWSEIERLDRAHWADVYRRVGPEPGFRASAALAELARRVRPGWPSAAERQRDLEHHVEFKRRLDRAAQALAAG